MKHKTHSEEVAWKTYEERKAAHDAARERIRPKREDHINDLDFDVAHSRWVWESCVDAPNKPGQEYANNH